VGEGGAAGDRVEPVERPSHRKDFLLTLKSNSSTPRQ
jgi:hypothetical protein